MLIKSAAVPHYSRTAGKVYYAVRVCPANVSHEPYTVYRRWDDFLDFSHRLASVFPSTTPEPDATDDSPSSLTFPVFRRVPRLSRKVTLFVTASTHSARRDELDLFVRQLFALSRAVTSEPLVRDFFAVRPNGMDGSLPPSPTPAHTAHLEQTAGQGKVYASIRERSPTLESGFQPTSMTTVQPPRMPIQVVRPSLAGKRSTPDLRRFMHASSSEEDTPQSSPRTWKFPSHAQGRVSTAPSAMSIRDCLAPFDLEPTSPIRGSGNGSDTSSMRTASTIRPSGAGTGQRSRASSRIASPLSFDSAISQAAVDDEHESSPMPVPAKTPSKARPGALKHFRSLQDMRAIVSPRAAMASPQTMERRPSLTAAAPLRPQPSPHQQHMSPASVPVMRSRSDSKILSKPLPLPQVAEEAQICAEPAHIPMRPTHTLRRASTAKSPTNATGGRSRSGTIASRASIEDLHRRAAHMMAMTPIQPVAQQHRSHGHRHTDSTASTVSTCSNSSSSSTSSSMYRSHSSGSSAGLGFGLGFTSGSSLGDSSYASSSSDSLHSPLESPNSSFGNLSSPGLHTPDSKWQQGEGGAGFVYNNTCPPLPFFPTPGACDLLHLQQAAAAHLQLQKPILITQPDPATTVRRSGRRRASSLHTPVLETIMGSPLLGGDASAAASAAGEAKEAAVAPVSVPSVTLKLMTSKGNYLMKVPKGASLLEVREKIARKCTNAEVALQRGWGLALVTAAQGKDTVKSLDWDQQSTITSGSSGAGSVKATTVDLQDEEDWQLALSLASVKITLKIG